MKKKTFFELRADWLNGLYGLFSMSLDTGEFVSEKMALRIERDNERGALKVWRKEFRRNKWFNRNFYTIKSEAEPVVQSKETVSADMPANTEALAPRVAALPPAVCDPSIT